MLCVICSLSCRRKFRTPCDASSCQHTKRNALGAASDSAYGVQFSISKASQPFCFTARHASALSLSRIRFRRQQARCRSLDATPIRELDRAKFSTSTSLIMTIQAPHAHSNGPPDTLTGLRDGNAKVRCRAVSAKLLRFEICCKD